MANGEKRIGWGEPVTLDAEQADALRDYVAGTHVLVGANLYKEWQLLREHVIPPVDECEGARVQILEAQAWLAGIEYAPGVDDPDYDEFEAAASGYLRQAIEAYKTRPTGCEMEMTGDDDNFECERCHFHCSTDIT